MNESAAGYLTGHLLVAMPQMEDPRFARTVIFLCAHTSEGAMGLVVNKLMDSVAFPDLLDQLSIDTRGEEQEILVHFGGPVESGRGFVLHSAEYIHDPTLVINEEVALTSTIDRGRRTEAQPAGARLRRLGAGPTRRRNSAQRLALRRRRRFADLRPRSRRPLGIGDGQARHQSAHAFGRRRPGLRRVSFRKTSFLG